jgi:hypothetical protein
MGNIDEELSIPDFTPNEAALILAWTHNNDIVITSLKQTPFHLTQKWKETTSLISILYPPLGWISMTWWRDAGSPRSSLSSNRWPLFGRYGFKAGKGPSLKPRNLRVLMCFWSMETRRWLLGSG